MGDGFLATFDGPARAIRCAGSGPERLEDVQAWMGSYRLMLEERFDRLEELLERTQEIHVEREFDAPRERVFAAEAG
jgi:hypothetical protein